LSTHQVKKQHLRSKMVIKCEKSRETLEQLLSYLREEQKCAYVRIGDGDLYLLHNHDDSYNRASPQFANEMKEVFEIADPGFMKCLPLYYQENAEPHMFPGNHLSNEECYNRYVSMAQAYLSNFPSIWSHVALSYQATYHPQFAISFLKEIKSACMKYPCFIIGNQQVHPPLIELLFGTKYQRIGTAPKDSYQQIETVWTQIEQNIDPSQYTIFVVFMGCAGRPLQKRIWKKYDRVFIFDVGSLLDILNGQNTRAWIDLSGFKASEFLELYNQA